MPKTNIDYSKSVIYKIEHVDNPELLYVGSTTDFTRRKAKHKNACINSKLIDYNYKVYQMIRANGNWESFKIMIIKEYPCNSRIELLIEEERIMKELKATLNTQNAYQTIEQKIENNKEQLKDYYINNKEEILIKCKQYRENHKEKINNNNKNYYNNNKEQMKEYQKTYNKKNKDVIKEKRKEYFEEFRINNKEKINQSAKERYELNKKQITCECGCVIYIKSKLRHEKTIKHINLINNIEKIKI